MNCPARVGNRLLLAMVIFLAMPLACEGRTTLVSPVVRVDLRHKLPPALQKQISKKDESYECRKRLSLSDQGARQGFEAIWRVLERGPEKYITAVTVEPYGATSGASRPSASAIVGELGQRKTTNGMAQTARVKLSWEATKGCSRISADKKLVLRADDPACDRPKLKMKLLTPVD